MIQKIIKVGNSAAVTIPKEFLKNTHLHIGDEVAVEANAIINMLIVKSKTEENKTYLTPEFKKWLDDFIVSYKPILKKLAHL